MADNDHGAAGEGRGPASSRRGFLLGAAGLTGVAAAATVWPAATAGAASDGRSYVSGYFLLTLDQGKTTGLLQSAEGGDGYADVVVEPPGADGVARKRPGRVKYGDITLKAGIGLPPDFYRWITAMFDRKPERRSGSIVVADQDFTARRRMDFAEALVTEVGMPALDAASKDAAKMTIKLSPEFTRQKAGAGGKVEAPPRSRQKQWLPANFRLRIDGLEESCSRVNKIEALTVKQKVTENAVGELRDYEKEPATLEIPNLVITFPESHAKDFYDWHEDFVIKGNNTEDREKGGTLEFLASDLETVLFTLTFSNLGIFKLAPEPTEAAAEGIRRVKAEMYCEDVKFQYGTATFS